MGTQSTWGRTINMSDDEYAMNEGESGASDTHMVEACQIRKGGYIMVKGKACKVKDVSVSKTGKHGHAKCKFSASCIFTGATCEELCPSTHSIAVPFVKKSDFQVMGLEGDYLQLMDEDMEMKEDLQLPNVDYKTDDDNKISEQIKSIIEEIDGGAEIELYCTVMQAIGKEKVVEIKKKDAA